MVADKSGCVADYAQFALVRSHRMKRSVIEVARLCEAPVELVELVVLIEDKRFWRHPGVDPLGITRALLRCVVAFRYAEGGSTIPEQLLKMRAPRRGRTLRERGTRAFRSILLTKSGTREALLCDYLASVYFGGHYYGVASAARGYFRKVPSRLSAAESFFLAERIASPNVFRPGRVSNIVDRQDVSSALGRAIRELPAIYGRFFGLDAARKLAETLGAQREP